MLPVLNKLINISKCAISTQCTLRLEFACFALLDEMILSIIILEGLATLFTAEFLVPKDCQNNSVDILVTKSHLAVWTFVFILAALVVPFI